MVESLGLFELGWYSAVEAIVSEWSSKLLREDTSLSLLRKIWLER